MLMLFKTRLVVLQMAVFLQNNCKFPGCGLGFSTLCDLIQHIEEAHIDADPLALEKQETQQPSSLALSYILKYFTDAAKKDLTEVQKKRARAQSPAVSIRSATPTGSEFDEEEAAGTDDEDSDDSWTTQEEFTSELILSMMSHLKEGDVDKPFACPVPGCKKRYKNVNGIKYHARHGHRRDTRVRKAYKCKCGKSYKTAQGLRNHSQIHHPDILTLQAPQVSSTALPLITSAQLQQVKVANSSGITTPVFALPTSVAQSVINNNQIAQSVNLNQVSMVTSKGQSHLTVTPTPTLQLISQSTLVPTGGLEQVMAK